MRLHERLQPFAGMGGRDHLTDFLDRGGAVVEEGHLLAQKVLHGAGQRVGGERGDIGVRQHFGLDILRTVHQVSLQGAVAGTLVQLGIHPPADQVLLEFGEDRFIAGGVTQQVLHGREGLGDVLAEAGDPDVAGVSAHLETIAAGQAVHLGRDVRGRMLRCSQIVEVAGGECQDGIRVAALVVPEGQGSDIILLILLVQEREPVHVGDGHVGLEVHENRLDRLDFGIGDPGQEGALLVAVGHDRRDARRVDLLDGRVLADVLIDDGVTLGPQVLPGPGDDIGLGHLLDPVHLPDGRIPGNPVDEGFHELVGPAAVGHQSLHLTELVIGLDGLYERFGEITFPEFGEFGQQDVADFFQGLSFLGHPLHDEEAVVGPVVVDDVGAQHSLVLFHVQVDQAGLPVGQDRCHDPGNLTVQGGRARGAPAHHQEFGFVSENVLAERGGDGILRLHGEGRKVLVGLPGAEVFLDGLDHLVRVKVPGEADGHVVRDVVGVLLLADGLQGRVLQVVLGADDGLRPVGVVGEQERVEGVEGFVGVGGQAHVLFLIDGLELGVEAAEYAVHEAVGLDLGPVLHLVGGNFLHIAGDIVGRVGIGPFGADDGHELVVLVRDRDLGGLVADGVDLMVQGEALVVVLQGAVHLKETVDGREHRLLGLVVLGAELLGTLEHHVLEVVGEAGVVGGVVLAARPDGDIGLDAGFVLVDAHIHFQAVGKGVDLRLERISLHGLILGAAGCGQDGQGRHHQQFVSHT